MSRRDGFDELSIGDDDLGEQAFGVAGDLIDVEGDEFVAGLHGVARGDVGGETLAAERDRLEADVDEYFQTVRGADGQGVPSRLEIGDLAVVSGRGACCSADRWKNRHPPSSLRIPDPERRRSAP